MVRASIAALAGRRIDADANARFPLRNVARVRAKIAAVLRDHRVAALVCSAACGADLIALEEAERLGLRRRIVLPFVPAVFREKSVADCPGDWDAYGRLVDAAEKSGDLIVLDVEDGDAAYLAANEAILAQAKALAGANHDLVAITVWEGRARAGTDITDAFRRRASAAGFRPVTVPTA